jgi:hypothetical protein
VGVIKRVKWQKEDAEKAKLEATQSKQEVMEVKD